MNYQEEQQNSEELDEEFEESDEDEAKNKKSTRALVIVEIFLLVWVVVLIFIFFNKRNDGQQVAYYSEPNNQNVSNNDRSDINLVNSGRNEIPASEITRDSDNEMHEDYVQFVPEKVEALVVENLRLTLPVPKQSPVSSEVDIPQGAIVISGNENGFSPNEFKVSKGETITLALVSRVDSPVVLTFYNPDMAAISIGCGPYEARWVTFETPEEVGEYEFRNDIFGRTNQSGKMIVE